MRTFYVGLFALTSFSASKGSHWWKSRTALEKALLVGWLLLLLVVTVLVAVLHTHSRSLSSFNLPPHTIIQGKERIFVTQKALREVCKASHKSCEGSLGIRYKPSAAEPTRA